MLKNMGFFKISMLDLAKLNHIVCAAFQKTIGEL